MSLVSEGLRPALTKVGVVPMRPRHLRGVLAIEQRCYPRPWSSRLFASELTQPESRRYFVALGQRTDRGWWPRPAVLGYAGVLVQAGEAHVSTVAVDPEQHRRKVATRLMVRLLREAVRLGATTATLEVRAGNRGAQRLYTGFGFAPVGVRPSYYTETGEDAVIMWAHELESAAYGERLDRLERRLALPGGSSGAPDFEVPWVKGRVGLGG